MVYTGDNRALYLELRALMRGRGILEQDICNTLGKTRQNLSTIFNRMNHGDTPDLYTLYRLAEGMGCELKIELVPKQT
ncbi:hypothetical protein LKD70_17835 [Ruminococcus sp. CLA-AA-H200]|uniref:HTH cro/C1-type domain-containing protein n=1 Tax=Ruminococcus turbiniformis TaxID=2881258 RepID=A0ABS8G3T2_9FIRM|nr:hypothetical protein [Ruminococcus turbiniformis]MCC2256243.1 hypothetical protein [Ruminococcus turbiniformis]